MGWPVISLTHLINISHTHAFVVGIMSNLPYLHIAIFQYNLGYHYPVPTQVFFLQLFWKRIIGDKRPVLSCNQQFKRLNGMLPHPHIQFLLHQSSSQQYSRLTRSPLYAALWITEAGFYMPDALPNATPKVSMQWRALKALPGKGKILHWTPCFSDPSTAEGRDSQPFMSRRQWREKENEERKTVVFIWAPFSFSAVFVTGEDTAEDTRDDSLDSDSNTQGIAQCYNNYSSFFWSYAESIFMHFFILTHQQQSRHHLEMWANAQRDGRPAKHRWCLLFNAAVWQTPTTRVPSVMLPRCETRWNLQRCPKLMKRSQPLVGRSSPYCRDMWRRYCCLTSFFPIVDTCLSCEDIAR